MFTLAKRRFPLRLLGFTAPALILVFLFAELPFLMTVYYSLCRWNGISKEPEYIGFSNFEKFFSDGKAMDALSFTLLYALVFVVAVNVLSLLVAVMLESKIKGRGFFRMAFYIPNVISLVVIGFIWKFIFSRVFDSLYALSGQTLGFLSWSWLGDPSLAFVSVVIVTLWQSLGFFIIVYVAGLQSVPVELMEAATIDGANRVQRFFRVTLPIIMPTVTFAVFYSISNSFKSFDLIFTLSGGGPGRATTSMALDIYNTAFNSNQYGYGSAKSVILFAIVALISAIQISSFSGKEVEA